MSDKTDFDPMRSENGLRRSIEDLPVSLIRHVAEPNMNREGLLKLWFGEPDVPTPQFIKDAATAALDDNHVFYAKNRGVPLLRQTISEYATRLHGYDIGIDRITVSGSGMNAIMMVSEALMSAGDNMVAVGPIWPNCKETVCIMDAEARQVSLRLGDDGRWQLRLWWKPFVTLIWAGGALIAIGGGLSLAGHQWRLFRQGRRRAEGDA